MSIPSTMKAVVIDGYGGPDVLRATEVSVPEAGPGEVLIKVAYAGVGIWDVKERDGTFASMLSRTFPRVVGGDGSGTVAAVGDGVTGFAVGDQVYGYNYGSPKGAFYAEYVAVPTTQVAKLPDGVDLLHGAALAIPSTTALRGLTSGLGLQPGQRLGVFGATGSVGLPAVQLAKAMGVHVLAVANGPENVEHALAAGADSAIDSKDGDVAAATSAFAPDGLDAVLATVNGGGLDELIDALKPGGRLRWPTGVQPEPKAPAGADAGNYDGNIDRALLDELNELVSGRSYEIALADQLPLEKAADAHRLIEKHVAGRPILVVSA